MLRPTIAYRSPRGAAIQRFGVRNVNGVTTVFGVVGKEVDARCRAAWLRVALPICPNGATGWVRAADVHDRILTRLVSSRLISAGLPTPSMKHELVLGLERRKRPGDHGP